MKRAGLLAALLLPAALSACADEPRPLAKASTPRSPEEHQAELARADADVRENAADRQAAERILAAGGCHVPTVMPALASTPASANVPVIVFDARGRVFRAGFDGREWTPLLDPGLEHPAPVQATADGRWILHGGLPPGAEERTWWLLDATTGKDRQLPGQAAWPLLSPDGALIAQVVRLDSPAHRGVELLDRAGLVAKRYPLPIPASDRFDTSARLVWTVENELVARHADDHFLLDRTSGQWRPIRLEEGGWTVLDGARRLTLHEPAPLPPENDAAPVYSDLWHATVHDPQGVLKITTPRYDVLRVAQAMGDNCVRRRISVLGWVEGHRLLAYAIRMNESGAEPAERRLFVYDVEAKGSTPLFADHEPVEAFVWPDWANPPRHQHTPVD